MRVSVFQVRDKLLLIFLWMVVAAAILGPLSSNFSLPYNMDYFNHVASIIQAELGLKEGQFPLRVLPVEFSGWRYPLFQFYSPTAYTLGGLIYHWLTPANPILAFKLTMWFLLVVGGGFMYKLANWLIGSRPAAILASVMYLTSPYYIIVVDHMGGFNEALALGLVPAVLYYTLQRYYHPTENKTLLQVALVWYLLATVHLITFVYTSFFVALLLILGTLKKPRYFLNLLDTGIAYIFGVMLAMWYLAPAFIFKSYLHINQLYGVDAAFSNDKLSLSSLLSPAQNITLGPVNILGYIDSANAIHPNLGCPLLFAVGICLYALHGHAKLDNSRANDWMVPLLILFAIGFMLAWSPLHISAWLPRILLIGQYSWRLLGQVMWIGALLFAWAVCWLFKNKLDASHVVVGIFLMMTAAATWIPITENNFYPVNIAELVKKPLMSLNKGPYLIDVKDKKNINQFGSSGLQNEKEIISVKEAGTQCEQKKATTICRFQVTSVTKLIELPVLFYPDLLYVTLNGKAIPYGSRLYQNYLLTTVKPIPNSLNTIKIKFRGLVWANTLSRFAFNLWLIFFLYIVLKHFTKIRSSR